MNNLLHKSLYRIENKLFIENKLNPNKQKKIISTLQRLINKLFFYLRLRKYLLPKTNLSDVVKKFEIKNKFDIKDKEKKDRYEIELEKVLAKVHLRYNYSQQIILYELVKQIFKKKGLDFDKFKWISLVYPIIHLSNDFADYNNPLHCDYRDTGINGTRTIWLPYSDYNYPGIIKKNKFLELLSCFVLKDKLKLKLLNKSKDINLRKIHSKGFWISWNDSFYHKGIVNTSNKTSIALVIRMSNKFDEVTFLKVEDIFKSKGLYFDSNEKIHNSLVKESNLISKEIIQNARLIENQEYFISQVSKLIKFEREEDSKFNKSQTLSILHMSHYAVTRIWLPLVGNKGLKWTIENDNKIYNSIISNLELAKKILENEIYKFI